MPADRVPSVLPCPKCQTLTAKAVKIHGIWPEVQYYRCEACAYLWSIEIDTRQQHG
jgi:transposase-like protein